MGPLSARSGGTATSSCIVVAGRGVLDRPQCLGGQPEGDVRDRLVLAQRLVSGSGQLRPQSRFRAFDRGPLIVGLGPAQPPFGREVGPKAHYRPDGSFPLGLCEQA